MQQKYRQQIDLFSNRLLPAYDKKFPHSAVPSLSPILDLRGIEPLSESSFIAVSPITAVSLSFPPLYARRQAYSFSSFIIRPHAQSLTCVVSRIVDAWVTRCGYPVSDSCHQAAIAKLSSAFIFMVAPCAVPSDGCPNFKTPVETFTSPKTCKANAG